MTRVTITGHGALTGLLLALIQSLRLPQAFFFTILNPLSSGFFQATPSPDRLFLLLMGHRHFQSALKYKVTILL